MRPQRIRLILLASQATPRQWVIGSIIAGVALVGIIGGGAFAMAILGGAQSWDRYAREASEYICERRLREERGGIGYRNEPVCQCTVARVVAQQPSLAGYLSPRTARREAIDMADLAVSACQREAAS